MSPTGGAAPTTITVVITTYNDVAFLPQALDSVMAQTRLPDEIIVVDDGGTQDPGPVVARYPAARLIRQHNQGLSAARNTGMAATTSDAIHFLDADDRLLPPALALGLTGLTRTPDAAFAVGGHRRIDAEGRPLGTDRLAPATLTYADLLRINRIGMHGAVTYRRATLVAAGGFDPAMRRCEDYEAYLRLARDHPVATVEGSVGEYRQHGHNMSKNTADMLTGALMALDRQRDHVATDPVLAQALREGRARWTEHYRNEAPRSFGQRLTGKIATVLPAPIRDAIADKSASRRLPRWGQVWFGDFDRTTPISAEFGFDRGTPIDRTYIADALGNWSADIKDRVLEIGDDTYSRTYGGDRITRQDVLDLRADAPLATIAGDLATPGVLPSNTFDCLIVTQTLHLIYDLPAAVTQMCEALKPGGIVLATVPGLRRIDPDGGEFWAMTPASATRLFTDVFGGGNVAVETFGNVYAATAVLHGLATEEVDRGKLSPADRTFPVIIAIRARKPA